MYGELRWVVLPNSTGITQHNTNTPAVMRRLRVLPTGLPTHTLSKDFSIVRYLDENVSAHALVARKREVHRRGARHHTNVRVLRSCRLCRVVSCWVRQKGERSAPRARSDRRVIPKGLPSSRRACNEVGLHTSRAGSVG